MKLKVWNQYLNQWENSFELRTVDGVLTAYIEDDVNECEVEATIILGTNLTDKDGKDIYEGDFIMKKEDYDCLFHKDYGNPNFVEIIFENGCFFSRVETEQTPLFEKTDLSDNYEVIGNRYENQELLKKDAVYTEGEKDE